MKRGVGLGFALMACAAAKAADPPAPAASAPARPVITKRLDLRIGDVRKYMMPNEYLAAINSPDADKSTIVVEGNRTLVPLKSMQPVPGGLMTYPWLVMHPLQSWRAFLPDPHAAALGPPETKVPPPIFRWGP